MMRDDHKKNQAIKLQQLFQEVNNNEENGKDKTDLHSESEFVEIDVLQLPPRSEVHRKSKWRIRLNLRSPIIRFIVVLLVIFGILGLLYYVIGERVVIFFT